MEISNAERAFKYNAIHLKDPSPDFTPEQVREFYSTIYPEILSAAIEGPEIVANRAVYTFRRAVGTKGATVASNPMRANLTLAEVESALVALCKRHSDQQLGDAFEWLRYEALGGNVFAAMMFLEIKRLTLKHGLDAHPVLSQ